ncbi:MAG: RimK/LysX family protein [bacterium]|nr:RimK/LysX family protein [bacterium]
MNRIFLAPLLIILLFCNFCLPAGAKENKTIIGRIERVSFPNHNFSLAARVDTGAHTSSMHMENSKLTKVNGQAYIEFDTEDKKGNKYHFKTKIHKETKVKGDKEKRFIIRETICLAKVCKEININLTDRAEYKNKFLLGRNFLRGQFLVDVSLSHALGD